MEEEFRPNAAAIIVRTDGKMLICERLKVKNAWQFPQGGVDRGETPRDALRREVEEEVGLPPESYEITEERCGYAYRYPDGTKKKNRYVGQTQTYFRCQLKDDAPPIDLEQKPREFRDHQWIDPNDYQLTWLPEFKREVYRQVLRDFFGVNCHENKQSA